MDIFWKKLILVIVVAVAIYLLLPATGIDLLGKFAIGWMLSDLANAVFKG